MTDAVPQAVAPATGPEPVHFWFDFISPFGYFASLRIDELAGRAGRRVEWHPLLVGVTVMKVMGLKPLLDTPLKKDYVLRQAARYARRHGVALKRGVSAPPMNPLPVARLFAWLRVHGNRPAQTQGQAPSGAAGQMPGSAPGTSQAHAFARAAFHAYWAEGIDLDTADALRAAAAKAHLPGNLVEAGLADAAAATLLRAEVDSAIALGVFGSPFVIVDGEPFFGVDSFELLEQWLHHGAW